MRISSLVRSFVVLLCALGLVYAACPAGYFDCNNDPSDGCEFMPTISGVPCPTCGCPNHVAVYRPVNDIIDSCMTNYGDCNTNDTDGCETDFRSDSANCGACGTACGSKPHANTGCSSSVCAISSCTGAYADCDMTYGNGCEVNTNTDTSNCGSCGTTCSLPHSATYTCSNGVCSSASCSTGYASCDNDMTNGCEVNTQTDTANCGSCANACSAANVQTYSCSAGMCGIAMCSTGFADCDGNFANGCEVTLGSDANNCGACANSCPTPANSARSCSAGVCGSSCSAPYSDCDGNSANGCETNTNTDNFHCGSCSNACNLAHATASCTAGSCTIGSCSAGYGNCDSMASTGCETQLGTPTDCSSCGDSCTATSQVEIGQCSTSGSTSSCQIIACNPDYYDCDGRYADGCETYYVSPAQKFIQVYEDSVTAPFTVSATATATYNTANSYHRTGTVSLQFNPGAGSTSLVLSCSGCINTTNTPALGMYVSGGAAHQAGGGQVITVSLVKGSTTYYSLTMSTQYYKVASWNWFNMPLVTSSSPAGLYDAIVVTSASLQASIYLDHIHLKGQPVCH